MVRTFWIGMITDQKCGRGYLTFELRFATNEILRKLFKETKKVAFTF